MFNHMKRFEEIVMKDVELARLKNRDYAGNGEFTGNFDRVSEILKLYAIDVTTPEGVAIVYMLKQFDAVLWNISCNTEPQCDTMEEKIRDIAIYLRIIQLMKEASRDAER